jgi:hypothetical protein
MTELDLSFYQFYRTGNKIIAVSTYAGKTVRGYAKCAPEDKDNEWYGKVLAAARCNAKIAKKRWNRAKQKVDKSYEDMLALHQELGKNQNYERDSRNAYHRAMAALLEIEEELKSPRE